MGSKTTTARSTKKLLRMVKMTTNKSPIEELKKQALAIAIKMKDPATLAKIDKENLKFGILQDDKVLTFTMTKTNLINFSVAELQVEILSFLTLE